MSSSYYPAQSLILAATTIRRERKLPPSALRQGAVREGQSVAASDVVLSGLMPQNYIILDALKPLGLKSAEEIPPEALLVTPGKQVFEGYEILSIGQGRKVRTLNAPTNAVFLRLEGGNVILQTDPASIEVQAIYPGRVTSVRNEGSVVLIEATGTLVQAMWGNGQAVASQLRLLPREGIESLRNDSLKEYRQSALVMMNPITSSDSFEIILEQEIQAIIAPSMPSSLRAAALTQPFPILLTEGFGAVQMSQVVYNLLRDNNNRLVSINAVEPMRWSGDRPELLIQLPTNISAPLPIMDQPLAEGSVVRITRMPLQGKVGRVRKLVESPRIVDNGLRLAGAEVQLQNGEIVFVPLANLETLGRALDRDKQSGRI